MRRAAGYAVLAACVVWLSGCGTINNFKDSTGPNVYGGTQSDAIAALMTTPLVAMHDGLGTALAVLPLHALAVVDLPLSAVADTLVLPITLRCGKPMLPFAPDTGNEQSRQPAPAATPRPEHDSEQVQQPAPATPPTATPAAGKPTGP